MKDQRIYSHTVPAELRQQVIAVLACYGASLPEIAELIGWSLAQVHKDIRTLGGHTQLAKATANLPGGGYGQAFLTFHAPWLDRSNSRADWPYTSRALETWLQLDQITAAIADCQANMDLLAVPTCSDPDVLKLWLASSKAINRVPVEDLYQLLCRCVTAKVATPPSSAADMIGRIRAEASREFRPWIAPVLGKSEYADLMACFRNNLTEREQQVLVKRLGLRRDDDSTSVPMTYTAIGRQLHLSGARVREIDHNGLNELRAFTRNDVRFQRLGEISESALRMKEEKQLLELQRRSAATRIEDLNRQFELANGYKSSLELQASDPRLRLPCSELELSPRAQSCLQNGGIENIWQLVTRTDTDILRLKNAGRKSLNEIKEVLGQQLSLMLNMKLPADFVP